MAERAAAFARPFGAGDLARAAGLYHDLGKFHPDFQAYLTYCEQHPGQRGPRVDHKAAGAALARQTSPLLPLVIMAHHGGLRTPTDLRSWLNDPSIAARVDHALDLACNDLPDLTQGVSSIPLPAGIATQADAEMFVRMLFSCLVDADFLDTEEHFDPARTGARAVSFDPALMAGLLRTHRDALNIGETGAVFELRREVTEACEAAGELPVGIYRMTVPTGGGKTLAGMAFALRHAAAHGKRRVVVAIPYTSITEQTAAVYREIFGDRAILEHHSGARSTEREGNDEPTAQRSWQRLAAENWDASVVVTTTVQLFESLLGNRVSTSRKLHNLCESVLILDEVQMIPPKLVAPIIDVLRGLVEHYGTTVLLSTATQPEFLHSAFLGLTEIAPDPRKLFRRLRRVEYAFSEREWSWHETAAAVADHAQAMVVLNTKRDAMRALDALGDPDALHLSTLLCGAHRRDALAEVRRRLRMGEPCRLVTTQVVEAGVDLDFPAVFRAMGPLDRIIQAAGRCNREGRLDRGEVTIFAPAEGRLPPGAYRTATQITSKVLRAGVDLHDPLAAASYFSELYRTIDTDAEDIQRLRVRMDYPEVARRFRMIDDDTDDVIVPYGDKSARATVEIAVDALRSKRGLARELLRRVQPYTVGLRRRDLGRAAARGHVAPVLEGLWQWTGPEEFYDAVRGLRVEGADNELLIA